ncbi:MAG: SDR family oxidoreductase [Phycisphaeraceae bacterium]|nr:SDR family oxidoreductase [Phycisphaeraceae bacterium]
MTTGAPCSGKRPIALVTGCARRVGRATTLALARAGFDIVGTYNTGADEADRLAPEVEAHGGTLDRHRMPLDDPESVRDWADSMRETLPRLDTLICNASVYEPTPLERITAEQAERFYRINAVSPLMLCAALAPVLRRSDRPGGGSIVAMSDIHAIGRPRAAHIAYAMSKAALTEMVRTLALSLAPDVRVNAVAPGVVAFPESGYESDAEMQARYLERVPLGRSGTVEEAANAVVWLALEATYTTGQILRVDGGRWLT